MSIELRHGHREVDPDAAVAEQVLAISPALEVELKFRVARRIAIHTSPHRLAGCSPVEVDASRAPSKREMD